MRLSKLAATAIMFSASVMSGNLLAQDLDLTSEEGKAGYSIGVDIGMNLVNLMEDLNMASLIQGVSDALNGQLQMSEEEIMNAIQAFSLAQQEKFDAAQAEAAQAGVRFLEDNGQRPEVMITDSGLQYEVLEEGEAGADSPRASDTVTVHYHGTLIDGTVFDSSVERNEPATFGLNQVISGWTEGVQLMKVGDKYRFYIPPELAYGEAGAGGIIGPNATLIFDVELLEIQ